MVEESTIVEETLSTLEGALEGALEGTIEGAIEPMELTRFEKQVGLTSEVFTAGYRPSTDLKFQFAAIMETMHNYHMSCEDKNQSRYNDIMNHILHSCELASTFVR